MYSRRLQQFGRFQMLFGVLLLILASGSAVPWGVAYGQTAGPLPGGAIPILGVTITVDNPNPASCEPITYSIVASNTGGADATNVRIVDTVPAGFEITNVSTSRGTVSINGQQVVVEIDVIGPGESVVITIQARACAVPGSTPVNRVSAVAGESGEDGSGVVGGEDQIGVVVAGESGEAGGDAGAPSIDGPVTGGPTTDRPSTGTPSSGTPSILGPTGADSSSRYMLIGFGLLLFLSGAYVYRRTRSAHV